MPNLLGSLLVELGVNTAAFSQGLTKATYEAKQFGKEVSSTFKALGNDIRTLGVSFGALGPAGVALSSALSLAGQAAGKAITSFAGVNRELGVFAAGAAGASAAAVSLAASVVGVAAKTAETMKQMANLSRATGMSTEAFTSFAFAARLGTSNLNAEDLAKGMERLARTAFSAAEGNGRLEQAFRLVLGPTTDMKEEVKNMPELLLKMADGFNKMADGPTKTALAIQLFSRGGAQMISFLSAGSAQIRKAANDAVAMGYAFNDQAAAGAVAFTNQLEYLKAGMQGAANIMTIQLLPTLTAVGKSLAESFKQDNGIKEFIKGLVEITKTVIVVGDLVWTVFKQVGTLLGDLGGNLVTILQGAYNTSKDLLEGNLKKAGADLKDFYAQSSAQGDLFLSDSKKMWVDFADFAKKSFSDASAALGTGTPFGGKPGGLTPTAPNLTPSLAAERNTTANFIANLNERASAELKLAAASTQSAAALEFENTQREASNALEGEMQGLISRRAALKGELENPAGVSDERRKNIEENLAQLTKYEVDLMSAESKIREAYAAIGAASTAAKISKALSEDYAEQGEAIDKLAEAYRQGGDAIQAAEIDKKLAKEKGSINDLKDLIEILASRYGATSPEVISLQQALDADNKALEQHRSKLLEIAKVDVGISITKEINALEGEAKAYDMVTAAAFKSVEARRAAAIGAAVTKATAEGKTTPEIAAAGQEESVKFQLQLAEQTNRVLAPMNEILTDYQEQREMLASIAAANQGNATLLNLIDAEVRQLNERWDEQISKVGTLSQLFQAWLDEIKNAGASLGGQFFGDLMKGLEAFNTQLTSVIVTGRANFKKLAESLTSSLVQTGLKGVEGFIAGKIGGLLGLSGKAGGQLGSPGNPMSVIIVGGSAGGMSSGVGNLPFTGSGTQLGGLFGLMGGGVGGSNGAAGAISQMMKLSKANTSAAASGAYAALAWIPVVGPALGAAAAIAAEVLLSGIGMREAGGPVLSGHPYIVGEKRPELFVPSQSGSIIPSLKFGSQAGNPGDTHIHVNTSVSMIDASDGEDFIKAHANHITDSVISGLRSRGMSM